MYTFLVPIKVLHEMGIRTKDTYAAAMKGIDLSMVEILKNLGYDHKSQTVVKLNGQTGPERVLCEEAKLDEFNRNSSIGLPEFVTYANHVLYEFLQYWKIGHVHSMHMDDDAKLQVEIAGLIHGRLLSDHPDSDKKAFELQLLRLAEYGFKFEKVKGMGHYQLLDTDANRKLLLDLFEDRGHNVFITSTRGYIRRVNLTIYPRKLEKWKVTSIEAPEPNTSNDMTTDEYNLVGKLIREIQHSLKMSTYDSGMFKTCCSVAESYFAQLCETVGFDGEISKTLRERYKEERAANLRSREIGNEIGSNFPVETCSEVMEKIKHNATKYCVENLHSVVRNLRISEIGVGYFEVDWIFDPEDFSCWMDIEYLDSNFDVPDLLHGYDDVFNLYRDAYGHVYLLDTENNRNCIVKFLRAIPGLFVESINIEYREDFGGIAVVKSINVKMNNVIGLLNHYDKKKLF